MDPFGQRGSLNILHKSFPSANYRSLLAAAHQQHPMSSSDNNCHPGILSMIGNEEPMAGPLALFSGQFGPAIYPLNSFNATQTAGNFTGDLEYTDLSGSDNQSGLPLASNESSSTSAISQPCLQILGKKSFKCIYNDCGSLFTRISDLKRHHQVIHERRVSFYCRFAGCRRAARGFCRKDKRDDHERRLHADTEAAQERQGSTGD